MRLRPRLPGLLLISIAACACTCGEKPDTTAPVATTTSSSAAARKATSVPITDARPAWTPAPDSETTRRLRAAQIAIEADQKFESLATEAELRGILRAKLGEFTADGEAASTLQTDAAAPLVAAARNYTHGAATARVKITDTARVPGMRHTLSSHLTLTGNEATGAEHGAFVRGSPALLARFEAQNSSRASALVANRYLVQITVQGATSPDAAQHILEHLDWPASQ